MAGYLDQYGVADSKREDRTRKIILVAVILVLLGTVGYFTFRTWSQERVVNDFLSLLSKKGLRFRISPLGLHSGGAL